MAKMDAPSPALNGGDMEVVRMTSCAVNSQGKPKEAVSVAYFDGCGV
jgi:hypothetical protein